MIRQTKAFLLTVLLLPLWLVGQVQSPAAFLGYELGEKFSRHHQVVEYFYYLANNSENVQVAEYGQTYEGRPLLLAFVSSKENLENLENIRLDNLRRTRMLPGTPVSEVPIVWLSYNVHGNEPSPTEAAMATTYELVQEGSDKADWLDDAVIIIDPCLNPDGRDRYANFYWQYGAQPYNPDPNAMEHNEIWPGGRANHYLFDLNRDWAWLTQTESKNRMKLYNQWLPHIHVDFHEQGINSPYYFAPAAQPYHELITPFQQDFQTVIGKNHATYFDANDWFYFTKQHFDLLYPSYGDTYPMYNGAIGMTYEQAGHGRAGLGIIKQEGDTLTLTDRITRHHTTGLSTIEVAVRNKSKLLDNFEAFFGDNERLKYKTFVLKYDGNDDKFSMLKSWLDDHDIRYGHASGRASGYNYITGTASDFTISDQDLLISTDQPKATLAHIFFEPKTALTDSVTYDITAWAVPYAYGIQAYATKQRISIKEASRDPFMPNMIPEKAYAFIAQWSSMSDARFLTTLLKAGIKLRFTQKPIKYQGQSFKRGSLIITRRDNKHLKNFERTVVTLANEHERTLALVPSGFMDGGPDIGSADVRYLKKPKIALLSFEGTSSLALGAQWHFMEQELQYPITLLRVSNLRGTDLSEYTVLIMQDGWYGNMSEDEVTQVMEWVSAGGKLIAVGSALNKLKDSDHTSLKTYVDETEKTNAEEIRKERKQRARMVSFDERERDFMKSYSPGAIYQVQVDPSHPLAFGYGDTYYTLKTTTMRIAYLKANNVGVIADASGLLSGFAGQYAQKDVAETLVFGVEHKGAGQIVYFVDNPLFRSFWQNGKLLMTNALFFVGQ